MTDTPKIIIEISDIQWDEGIDNIPTSMTFFDMESLIDVRDSTEIEDILSNFISDESGFCHEGFSWQLAPYIQ